MHAHRVDVFDEADGDHLVLGIAHDFDFQLFPTEDGFFDEALVRHGEFEAVTANGAEFFHVVAETAACTTHGVCRANHHRVADFLRRRQTLFHGAGNPGGQHRLAQGLTQLLEQLPILGHFDAAAGGAQQLGAAFGQNALLFQLHGQIQSRLAAQTGNNGVGALVTDDFGNVFQRQGLHIDLVRDGGVGHDGGRVGVAQDDLVPLLLQRQTGLGAGVVEFRRLADDDGAGADDQYFFQIRSFRHDASSISRMNSSNR